VSVSVSVSVAAGMGERGGGIEEGKLWRLQRRRIWMKRTVKRIHVRGFWGWRREVREEVRVILEASVLGWGTAEGTDFGSMRRNDYSGEMEPGKFGGVRGWESVGFKAMMEIENGVIMWTDTCSVRLASARRNRQKIQ